MKSNAFKLIFLASFIPYMIVLIVGIYSAINGTHFFGMEYGLDGFLVGVLRAGVAFTVVPVIPTSIVIEITYGMRRHLFKNISFKKYAVYMAAVFVLLSSLMWIYFHSYQIIGYFEKKEAEAMVSQADITIPYKLNETHIGGIYDIAGFEHDTILIDLDRPEIGFLIHHNSSGEFWKVQLIRANSEQELRSIKANYYLQTVIPLEGTGRLITFSDRGDELHRTIAMILEKQDGSVFYVDNMLEENTRYTKFTGLNWSEYSVEEYTTYGHYFSDG